MNRTIELAFLVLKAAFSFFFFSSSAWAVTYSVQTVQITNDSARQLNPSIDGDIVVWEDYRSGNGEIYGYNLSTNTEFLIATGGADKEYPQINGHYVTWVEETNGNFNYDHLYTKNLASGTVHAITTASAIDPYYSVVDDTLFYSAEPSGTNHNRIFAHNLATGVATQISPTASNPTRFPNASGRYATWQSPYLEEVVYYDIDSGSVSVVPIDDRWMHPVVNGNLVIGINRGSNFSSATTRAYDIASGTFLDLHSTPGYKAHPTTDGRYVAWFDYQQIPAKVVGYDLAAGTLFDIIPDNIAYQSTKNIELSGDRLAWTRTNAGFTEFNIYVTTIVPEPSSITLVLLAITACAFPMRRWRNQAI